MSWLRLTPLLLGALLLNPTLLLAQVDSGPQPGGEVETLKAYAVTGDGAGAEVDYAAQRKEKSTLVVFIQADKWDRPVARFLKALDQGLADRDDAQNVAVWLTDDVEKSKEYLTRARNSLRLENTALAVYPGDKGGPPGWNINTDAFVTAVVVKDGKVAASFGYRSVNETAAPEVLERLKANAIGE